MAKKIIKKVLDKTDLDEKLKKGNLVSIVYHDKDNKLSMAIVESSIIIILF